MSLPEERRILVAANGLSRRFEVSPPWLERVLSGKTRAWVHAVTDVSIGIHQGETLALVGESGCGKSTVARLLVGLYEPSSGEVLFDGKPLPPLGSGAESLATRRRIQMIFQDPYASLNPRWRVKDIIAEPLEVHRIEATREARYRRAAALLLQVGLSGADGDKFPHQFSGGQRQRISIARALASQPDFLVCDEPTSALDVSVQAQVLNLMKDLQRELGLTYLFISHNLAVVHHVADRVGVMYLGRVVELAPRNRLFARPAHPYSRMLLDAIPDLSATGRPRTPVQGEVPNPLNPPSGCSFHPRCPRAQPICQQTLPPRVVTGTFGGQDSWVQCHFPLEDGA